MYAPKEHTHTLALRDSGGSGGAGAGGGARLEEEEPVHVRRILRSTTNQMLQNAAYCLGVTAAQVRADFYFCHEPQAAKRRLLAKGDRAQVRADFFFQGIAAAKVATTERESERARERKRTEAQLATLVAALLLMV